MASTTEPNTESPPVINENIKKELDKIADFFKTGTSTTRQQTSRSIIALIQHTKRFYFFKSITMKLRQLLFFVETQEEMKQDVFHYCLNHLAFLSDILPSFVTQADPQNVITTICAMNYVDLDAKVMAYDWHYQHAFDENVFYADRHLRGFVQQFIDSLDPASLWYQFTQFTDQCTSYFNEKYSIPEGQPQIYYFTSRSLYDYCDAYNPLFRVTTPNEVFLTKISKLRVLEPEKLLINAKFLPKDNSKCYTETIEQANILPFYSVPDDLFYRLSMLHETLYEEIVRIMFNNAKPNQSLSVFRGNVEVGQEDIMPIIIYVLVHADIPNLPEMVDFFNEFTTQNEVNSKSGLYMANIATAFGAIMNWEI